ncbi:hypothetical protein HMPREF3213_00119 [Heyndrickxia coagulans]|uniref:Uncharacterized protein n=1 Tax=Heyndrickxia coagulans TaxID=1398 RepID=A0A133L343_HEYCO|nr:hypothetical protein HMPREF3213_00119 [Heyndrickxia coagulans]
MLFHFGFKLFNSACKGKSTNIRKKKGMWWIMKKSMAMTAVALGAAYLLRNKRSRSKLMNQLSNFAGAKK